MPQSLAIPALSEDLKSVLIDANTIGRRVTELARQIDNDYQTKESF
jgi:hypoxanthine phosphoribosyltransferase